MMRFVPQHILRNFLQVTVYRTVLDHLSETDAGVIDGNSFRQDYDEAVILQ
jgi:hypothetical protein